MTREPCPTCGGTRDIADRDPHSVLWQCQTCGFSRETHHSDALHRAYTRRSHP